MGKIARAKNRILRSFDGIARFIDFLEIRERWRPFWAMVLALGAGAVTVWQGWFGGLPWPGQFMLGWIFLFSLIYVGAGIRRSIQSLRRLDVHVGQVMVLVAPFKEDDQPLNANIRLLPFRVVNRTTQAMVLDLRLRCSRLNGPSVTFESDFLSDRLSKKSDMSVQPIRVPAQDSVEVSTILLPTALDRVYHGVPGSINIKGDHALILDDRVSRLKHTHTEIYLSIGEVVYYRSGKEVGREPWDTQKHGLSPSDPRTGADDG